MMAEFAAELEDIWGLQPITGAGDDNSGVPDSMSCNAVMDDFIFSYPDHDLYFPNTTSIVTRSDQTLTDHRSLFFPAAVNYSGSSSSSSSSSADSVSVSVQKQTTTNEAYVPKYKRRKNQQKRVILQVTADDLSSDMWAWRKYGQKPIKGSPYPRSYYRCSSTKGCLARRQVEQSCTDPSVFIVTYSGEHNHSQPTRKNALAGTIRHKFQHSKSPMSPSALAPPTPRLLGGASIAAVVSSSSFPSSISSNTSKNNVNKATIEAKDDIVVKDEIIMMDDHDHDDDNVLFSGMKLDDEFFSGLEDIDDLISELLNNTSPRP